MPAAISGVVVGHVFVYRMFFPETGHYHSAMQSTGHGYFSTAVVVAGLLALFSFFAHVLIGYQDKKKNDSVAKPTFWKQAALLIVLQLIVFTVMELAERHALLDFGGVLDFITSPLFLVGLLYQVAVALGVNLLLHGAEKIGYLVSAIESVFLKPRLKISSLCLGIQQRTLPTFNCRAPPTLSSL